MNRSPRRSGRNRRYSPLLPVRLTKWQPAAARWPTEGMRTWLLTRTQQRDERINNVAVNRALSVVGFSSISKFVSIRLQFARLTRQKRHKSHRNQIFSGQSAAREFRQLDDILRLTARADRNHHLAAFGKLRRQRLGHLLGRSGDHDAV